MCDKIAPNSSRLKTLVVIEMTTINSNERSDKGKVSFCRSIAFKPSHILTLLASGLCLVSVVTVAQSFNNKQVSSNISFSQQQPQQQTLQSISNWLKLTSSRQYQNASSPITRIGSQTGNGVAVEVSPPPANLFFQYQPVAFRRAQHQHQQQQQQQVAASSTHTLVATANRSARTVAAELAPDQQQPDSDQDQFNLFVSNVCERDFMLIRVRTSRPFYGVIHTLNYRRKPLCSFEGDGATDYQLNISHALDSRDPAYCGVIKLRKQNERDQGELLSVVLAIRMHKNVELTDDKLVVLNCTNRCRLFDCSSVSNSSLSSQRQQTSGQLQDNYPIKQRQLEKEFDEVATSQDQTSWWTRSMKRIGDSQKETHSSKMAANNGCSLWRLPWVLALICCLLIMLAGAVISNCIICMSVSSARSSRLTIKPTSKDNKDLDNFDADRDEADRMMTQQKYIDYDNSEYHRPVDVAYLHAASSRANRDSRHTNGSHQHHQHHQQQQHHHHHHHQPRSPYSSQKTAIKAKR